MARESNGILAGPAISATAATSGHVPAPIMIASAPHWISFSAAAPWRLLPSEFVTLKDNAESEELKCCIAISIATFCSLPSRVWVSRMTPIRMAIATLTRWEQHSNHKTVANKVDIIVFQM